MNRKVLVPIPSFDFDPTEVAIPWQILKNNGIEVVFATPNAKLAQCDLIMLNGRGLGPFASTLVANNNAKNAFEKLMNDRNFQNPISWDQIVDFKFDALLLPGGHAQGVKEYLESKILQIVVSDFFEKDLPVAAICHGVVLAARSKDKQGNSVLKNKKTTGLLKTQELLAWFITYPWKKNYYRTYKMTVEDEVKSFLKSPKQFILGPVPLLRDSAENLKPGFVVEDGNYISARWPGDAHAFAQALVDKLIP